MLDSCTNYKDYIDKAVELKQKAICFTEHGNIFNWIEKKMYCKEKGIKYIHGVEIYLTESLYPKIRDNYHTVLIARNHEGFKEINKLIDASTQPDHFYYTGRISFDEFLNISDNVITTSACLASPLNKLPEDNPYFEKLLQKYDYYEIQPHINSDEQKAFNQKLYKLANKYNKPLIAGTDTHSLNKYKAECRSILQKAKKINYTNEDEFDLTYKSYDELVNMFKQQNVLPENAYMEAINNTNIIVDGIEDFDLDLSFKYPKLYDDENTVFEKRVKEMYNQKVKNGIIDDSSTYLENIKEEIRVFKKIGMIGFMLFMSELTTWCRENNIPFGFCRGSVGGSTVAYILDITDVNPVVWGTVFSRFANEDRVEIGDIDLDFSPDQRQLVYEYIIDRFGSDYTSYILAIGTISKKGTIDEIGRALHFKWKEENQDKKDEDSPYNFQKIMAIKNEFDLDSQKAKKKYPGVFYYYEGLLDTAISQSMHPAGVIASPISLYDNYGTFWSENKRITQIDMDEVHEVSLVKYDILGLKNIQIIKDTCHLAGIKYPLSHEINWDNKDVWNDIVTSNVGIFQYESVFAHSLVKQYKPQSIRELSLVNAALRPSGASYRDRLMAREINKNPSKQIDELLKENNGFLTFQEDVSKFLQDICGLSGSEADNVRRAIGRKDKDRLEKALPNILEGYCDKSDKPRDIAKKEAKEFLQIIEDSSEYMFGLNHAVGYSMIGYLCAYLRYHYPLEFVTAYLNNAQSQDDINEGTKLASLKNIKIKPIKFGYSRLNYYPDKETNSVYKGLSSIKGFGEKIDIAGELSQFSNKTYVTFTDILVDIEESTKIGSSKVEILIKLNYFSQFGRNKKLLNIFKEFTEGKNRYKRTHKQQTKDKRISLLYQYENSLEDISLPISKQIKYEEELLGSPMTIYELPRGTSYIIDLSTKNSPKVKVYGLATGKTADIKMYKQQYNKNPFKKGDIVRFMDIKRKQRVKFVGKNSNGKPIFEPIKGEYDLWGENYNIMEV